MDDTKYIGMDVHKETISIAVLNSSGKLVMQSVIETKAITCALQSVCKLVGHSAFLSLGMGSLDAGHQISNYPFETAEPMRHARRNHDYIAGSHAAALAALNRASDAGAGGF
jgi:hypothetical protein